MAPAATRIAMRSPVDMLQHYHLRSCVPIWSAANNLGETAVARDDCSHVTGVCETGTGRHENETRLAGEVCDGCHGPDPHCGPAHRRRGQSQ